MTKESQLHVVSQGSGAPAVFLVHGFGASGHYWRKWIPDLSAHHGTWVVDQLGFGRSPAPPHADYSPRAQGDYLFEAVRASETVRGRGPTPPILVGHSLGAATVLFAALRIIEGDGPGALSAMVLMSPAVYPQQLPRYLALLRTPVIGDLFRLGPLPRWAIRYGLRGITAAGVDIDDEMVEGYRVPLEARFRRGAILRAARQIEIEDGQRLVSRLGKIEVPVLVLWGNDDPVVPPAASARLVDDLPHATGLGLPGVGHLPTEEAPEASLKATLSFISRVTRASLPTRGRA